VMPHLDAMLKEQKEKVIFFCAIWQLFIDLD
jgi:hypothetical protein